MVRATIPETESYKKAVCEGTFKIIRKTPEIAKVMVIDTFVGAEYEPEVTTDSDGKDDTIFEYKKEGEEDAVYSEVKPTAAGSYVVHAAIPETDNYEEIECEGTFKISKKTPTAVVTAADIKCGEKVEPVVTTDSDGKDDTVFEYRKEGEEDTAYSETKPSEAGSYIVRATVPETDNYEKIECTGTFKIERKTATAEITVADVKVGEAISPVLTTDSDGKDDAVIEYKEKDSSDDMYSINAPKKAGSYVVRATIPETDIYEKAVCEGTFSIGKKTAVSEVSVDDVKYGEEVEPVLTTDSNGKDDAVFEYKKEAESESAYVSGKPESVGSYMVRVTIPETDEYEKSECKGTFKIIRLVANSKIAVSDVYVGTEYEPVLTTDSDGKDDAVIEYKETDSADSKYSITKPSVAGSYTVRATIPETDKYEKSVCEGTFKISKKTAKAEVDVADVKIGEDIAPVLTTDSDGKEDAVFEYKKEEEPESEYSVEKPTLAGSYVVRVTIPETDKYEKAVCEGTFKISRLIGESKVEMPDVFVGMEYEPVLTTDSDGKGDAVFEYKKEEESESEYSAEKPILAGSYVVRATIPETEKYEKIVCIGTFKISKNIAKAEVDAADVKIGEEISPVLTTDSDGKEDAVFEYRNESDPDSAYTSTKPEIAGSYMVRATIPETEKYEKAVCEGTFKISRLIAESRVEVSDVLTGMEYEPVLTTDSDGKEDAVFEYKKESDPDSAYTSTKPETAGSYMVRVTIPETDMYEKSECMTVFIIGENGVAKVEVPDVYVGMEYEPILTTDSDGKDDAIFEYKHTDALDDAYSTEKPSAAGSYMVRVTIPATDSFDEIVCKGAFKIMRYVSGANVSVSDIKYGMEISPVLTTDSDGKESALYEYMRTDVDEGVYSSTVPTVPGSYKIRVTVPETDRFEKAVCEGTFKINKLSVTTAEVTIEDVYVGMDYTPVVTTDSDGKGSVSFEYKSENAVDDSYTSRKPVKAGTYIVRAVIPATDIYEKAICEASFKIMKLVPTAEVIINDQFVGVSYKPQVKTDSDGGKKVTYEFKRADEDDSSYAKTKPSSAGIYVVRATIPETDKYEMITCEKEFSIKYISDSKVKYTITGDKGKNGYYISDVYLKPTKGYKISASRNGKYEDKILYDESVKVVYLRRISDGACTDAKSVEEIKIDKELPVINKIYDDDGHIVNADDGDSIYVDKMAVIITDENLTVVKVNGDETLIEGNTAEVLLDPENGSKPFLIYVEDIAGNQRKFEVLLSATWMKDNIIPVGAKIPLTYGTAYNLEAGSWTVSGDSTVYSGGREFYVVSSGDYTFEKK